MVPRSLTVALAIAACVLSFFALTASAGAAISYLRPNSDITLGPWSLVGATSGWASLDDNVSPSETPTAADYVTTSAGGRLEVDLESAPLAGSSGVELSAWFYTPSSDAVRMEIRTGRGDLLAKVDVKSAGWHSAEFDKPVTQAALDSAFMRFERIGGSLPKVYAAFLRLSQTPSPTKVYWGAWIDGHVYTTTKELEEKKEKGDAPWELSTWETFKTHTGEKAPSIIHFGQPAPWNQSFKTEPMEKASERGAIPLMDMDSDGIKLTELLEGKKDAKFKEWAEAVKAYGKPFFFRWEWEMNLAGSESANNPANYVAVWQRIHNIAEAAGAKNITWVWCPNVSYTGSASLKSLYPGNEYVDWTCMDGYNHGTKTAEWSPWTNFKNVFAQTYSELTSSEFSGHEKPLMIGETASTEIGGSKSEWIAEGLGTTLPQEFPRIKAILWFNWDITDLKGTHWDWQIESSPAAQASFANAISSPYFASNTFGELTPLTRIQALP